MPEETGQSVDEFLASVKHPVRRRDARTLRELMTRVTGMPARMWGSSIVGFGKYKYKYASAREGEAGAAGFPLARQRQSCTCQTVSARTPLF